MTISLPPAPPGVCLGAHKALPDSYQETELRLASSPLLLRRRMSPITFLIRTYYHSPYSLFSNPMHLTSSSPYLIPNDIHEFCTTVPRIQFYVIYCVLYNLKKVDLPLTCPNHHRGSLRTLALRRRLQAISASGRRRN